MSRIPVRDRVSGSDAVPAASGPGAAAELRRLTVVPVVTLAAATLLFLVAPALGDRIALPVAAIGLLIGVPHGAVDHLVPEWVDIVSGRMATGWLVVAYVSVALVAAAALVLAPTVAVLTFLLLSAVHFGTAETAFAAERRGQGTPRPWACPLASASHGAVVVGLLLWAHPAQVDPWLRLIAPGAADVVTRFRAPGLVLVVALALAQMLVLAVRIRTGAALRLVEFAVLVAAFAVAPPLVALGVYFGCWHAVRHTGRLLDTARRADDRGWGMPARRLLAASLLPAAAALATLAGLVLVGDRAPLVLEVSVLLALTFPHSALVWFVDARRHARPTTERLVPGA